MPERHHVVVDGSNLATEGRTEPSLAQLDEAVRTFAADHPDVEIVVVVDATFAHRIPASERAELEQAELHGELVSPPAGTVGRGDAFVLRIAERTGATVLSNDSFQEFQEEHPWLFDPDRLVGGKPVPGVGWIFTQRLPVRAPKKRAGLSKRIGGGRTGSLGAPASDGEAGPAATAKRAGRKSADESRPVPGIAAVEEPPFLPAPVVAERLPAPPVPDRDGHEGSAEPTAAGRGRRSPSSPGTTGGRVRAAAKKVAAAAKKATAKKAPAKDAPAKKASGKDAPAKRSAAKNTPKKSAPAKSAPAKKAPAKKAPGRDAPAEEVPAKEGRRKKATAKKASSKNAGAKDVRGTDEVAKDRGRAKKQGTSASVTKKDGAAKKKGASPEKKGTPGSGDQAEATKKRKRTEAAPAKKKDAPGSRASQAEKASLSRKPRGGGHGDDPSREAAGSKRKRRVGPPTAVNEPLPFISFVAENPIGSTVEGEVVSFTSHGAMVDVELPNGSALHCYVPLGLLADPPPRRAREVLSRGERRRFVLATLDPARRAAELGLPEMVVPG